MNMNLFVKAASILCSVNEVLSCEHPPVLDAKVCEHHPGMLIHLRFVYTCSRNVKICWVCGQSSNIDYHACEHALSHLQACHYTLL